MKVLIACEFSGIVRDAFIAKGHDAMSCDLIPSEKSGPHHQGDVMDIINDKWDIMIAHPPCTYLAISGARWWKTNKINQQNAINFFMTLMNSNIDKICIENPVGIMSTVYRKPDQYIQPWEYGHGETKKTGLWLKNLPKLEPTNIVDGRKPKVHFEPPGPNRSKNRSRTYQGIANAITDAYG